MKIAILIISTKHSDYSNLYNTVNKTWVNEFTHACDIYHLIAGHNEESFDGNIIYSTDKEGTMEIGYKTINAFDRLRNKYDYIIRTNLSSYINVNILLKWLKIQPRTNFWCGYGVKHFSSGAFYILSRDLVDLIVDNKIKWNHDKLDDVALSEILYYDFGFNCQFIERVDFIHDNIIFNKEFQVGHFIKFDDIDLNNIHFRFSTKDANRKIDCDNMIKLHRKIINLI